MLLARRHHLRAGGRRARSFHRLQRGAVVGRRRAGSGRPVRHDRAGPRRRHIRDLPLGIVAGAIASHRSPERCSGRSTACWSRGCRISSFIVTLGTMGIGTGLAYVGQQLACNVAQRAAGAADELRHPEAVRHRALSDDRRPDHLRCALVRAALDRASACIRWRSARRAAAAERAGIRSSRHVMALFILMGALAGIAAVLDPHPLRRRPMSAATRLRRSPAIAAVVIGGTSLFGGRATIAGSMVALADPGHPGHRARHSRGAILLSSSSSSARS